MFRATLLAAALVLQISDATYASVRQQSLENAWSKELTSSAGQESPVKRVVNLLNKMKAELEKEADNEAGMYDKMVCWCKTGEKQKTQAIAAADAKDIELSSEIEGRSARGGNLGAEITNMKSQIADDTAALKMARSVREKEAGAFREDETSSTQAITNLKNAVAVLSRHQGGNFLQLGAPLISGLRVLLRDLSLKYELLVAGHERRGSSQAASLIAIASRTAKAGDTEEAAEDTVRRTLLGALDVTGEAVPDELPLNLAERMWARPWGLAGPAQHRAG